MKSRSPKGKVVGTCVWLRDKHFGFKLNLFIHRNHKFIKQVQGTQKQYAYLSVIYRKNDNYIYIYDGGMGNYCRKSVSKVKGNILFGKSIKLFVAVEFLSDLAGAGVGFCLLATCQLLSPLSYHLYYTLEIVLSVALFCPRINTLLADTLTIIISITYHYIYIPYWLVQLRNCQQCILQGLWLCWILSWIFCDYFLSS